MFKFFSRSQPDVRSSEPKLRGIVYVVGVLLLVGVAVAVWQAPMFLLSLLPWPTFTLPGSTEETPPPPTLGLDERYTIKPSTYGLAQPEPKPREPIPTAVPVARAATPPVVTPPPVAVPTPAPVVQAQTQPMPDWLEMFKDRERREQARDDRIEDYMRRMMQGQQGQQPSVQGQQPRQGQGPAQPQGQGEKPKKQMVSFGKPQAVQGQEKEDPTVSEEARAQQARDKAAQKLVDPAIWAIPQNVNRTLYRTQVLPCEVLALIDTDAPGQIQLQLTLPAFGYYGQGDELFPKGSRVIGKQEGKPEYGARTIAVKLEQVHLPNGTIVEIPGEVGNEDGSNQLKGKTNNHWGPLFAGAVANALVSLGGGYITGTPGKNQYYQDPAQQAMAEGARSFQQDAKTVITRETKRPPTITRDPKRKDERFCTIQMLKNLQFSDFATVVK